MCCWEVGKNVTVRRLIAHTWLLQNRSFLLGFTLWSRTCPEWQLGTCSVFTPGFVQSCAQLGAISVMSSVDIHYFSWYFYRKSPSCSLASHLKAAVLFSFHITELSAGWLLKGRVAVQDRPFIPFAPVSGWVRINVPVPARVPAQVIHIYLPKIHPSVRAGHGTDSCERAQEMLRRTRVPPGSPDVYGDHYPFKPQIRDWVVLPLGIQAKYLTSWYARFMGNLTTLLPRHPYVDFPTLLSYCLGFFFLLWVNLCLIEAFHPNDQDEDQSWGAFFSPDTVFITSW